MEEKLKTVTLDTLVSLSDEEFKEYSKVVKKEYWRRLKLQAKEFLSTLWNKSKIGGTRVRDIVITCAAIEAIIWLGKEIFTR